MTEDVLGFKVRMALKVNPDLLAIADSIGIDESNGIVTLSGTVPTRHLADACELMAMGVADVAGVKNFLTCADEPEQPGKAPAGEPVFVPPAAVLSEPGYSAGTLPWPVEELPKDTEGPAAPEIEEPPTAPSIPIATEHPHDLGPLTWPTQEPHLAEEKPAEGQAPAGEPVFVPPAAILSEPGFSAGTIPWPVEELPEDKEQPEAEGEPGEEPKPAAAKGADFDINPDVEKPK